MTDVICGRGRLGGRIAAQLAAMQRPLQTARIDRDRGLLVTGALPAQLDLLVLCLVPVHPEGGSGWAGLLDGLCRQVEHGALRIGRVVHISSTAVYECYAQGWVDADSSVQAASARSAGLIAAEQQVRQLSADHCIIRLAGLIGPGYERFDPVTMSVSQPRHAVDVRAAAMLAAQLAVRPERAGRTELVTDGGIYFQQQRYPAERSQPVLAALAQQHRLMLPSTVAVTID